MISCNGPWLWAGLLGYITALVGVLAVTIRLATQSISGRVGSHIRLFLACHTSLALIAQKITLNMATGTVKNTSFIPFGEIRTGDTGDALDETGLPRTVKTGAIG